MSVKTNGETLDFLRTSLTNIRERKQAAHTEAGGYSGPSSHPSAKEDDQSISAPEGARSTENTADIKEDVHQNTGVDGVQGSEQGGADDNQYNIGNQAAATGEDPSTENPDKINKKDDQDVNNQSTSHPAKGTSKQSDAIKEAGALGDKILADIAVMNPEGEKQAAEGAAPAKTEGSTEGKTEGASNENKQAMEGMSHGGHGQSQEGADADMKPQMDNKHDYEEDGSVSKGAKDSDATKKTEKEDKEKSASEKEAFEAGKTAAQAATAVLEDQEKIAAQVIGNIEKQAEADADTYCDFLAGYNDGNVKAGMHDENGYAKEPGDDNAGDDKGEDHEGKDEDREKPTDEGGGEGEMDADSAVGDMMGAEAMGGGGGGMPPGMEEGGMPPGMMGGGMPPGMEGGMPPGMEGGMPPGMEGGMPPGMEGGMGGLSEEELMAALQQAAMQSGMGPEAMQVAASHVEDARKRDTQRHRKVAAYNHAVTNFKQRFEAIKSAQVTAAAAAPAPAAAAAAS